MTWCTVVCARVIECVRAYAKVCLLYRIIRHVPSTYVWSLTNGANYKWCKLHHSPWHSDIRTRNQLNTSLGCPDPGCQFLALHQIYQLPPSHLCSHLDYPSHHCSWADFWCWKYFQVYYPHHYLLDDGWFSIFSKHWLLECVVQEGTFHRMLLAKVIFPTVWILPLHHGEIVSRILRKYLQCVRCIIWLWLLWE